MYSSHIVIINTKFGSYKNLFLYTQIYENETSFQKVTAKLTYNINNNIIYKNYICESLSPLSLSSSP